LEVIMRFSKKLSILVATATLGLVACGSDDVGNEPSAEQGLAAAIAALPNDVTEKAAALDALSARYGNAPLLLAALRDFSAENTPGLLKRVEQADGRFVTFIEFEDGALAYMDGGPRVLPSLVSEFGLEGATMAELWEALIPNEPVPESLIAAALEPTTEVVVDVAAPDAATHVLPEAQLVTPSVPSESNPINTRAFTEDQFVLAGGCSLKTAPGGPNLPNQVTHSPMCEPVWGGSLTATLTSFQHRTRTTNEGPTIINVQIARSGSAQTLAPVPKDHWLNTHFLVPITCRNCGSGCYRCEHRAVPWNVQVLNGDGDLYRIGGLWMNSTEMRLDTQPWCWGAACDPVR
jgi:hypothetical protein